MTTSSKLWLASGLVAALVSVAGCSNNSDNNDNPQSNVGPATVPDSASTSGASFLAYLMGLDKNDEKSEPFLIKESFAVPPDESSESQLLM
jgi:hypothetical protein